MSSAIQMLQEWYLSQCNGDWEHTYGITIETIDNPGWTVEIDISDTELETRKFSEIKSGLPDDEEWMLCRIETREQPDRIIFRGSGDAAKLEQIIQTFIDWASKTGDEKTGE